MARNFGFFVALCALASIALAEELYSDKYDFIDVDGILTNDRIRNQYYDCLIDASPCLTPDAKFMKDKFPEAIVTKCRKCTARQKVIFEKVVLYYTEKEPEKWKAVLSRAIEMFAKKRSS